MSLVSIPVIGVPGSGLVQDSAPVFRVFDTNGINWPSLVNTEIGGLPRSVFEYTENGITNVFQSIYPADNITNGSGVIPVDGVQADAAFLFVTNNLPTSFDFPTNGGISPGVYTVRAYTKDPTQGGVLVDNCLWEAIGTVPLDGCSFLISNPGPAAGTGLRFFSGDTIGFFSWFVRCTTPEGAVSTKPFNMTVIPS
jgi:hypothetical protein